VTDHALLSASALLDVRVQSKRYGARAVLDDMALRLAPGEIVSLVGPSGCGKSTLLRIVAGLDRDYAGTVRLNGALQHGPSSQLGVIFQEPRLLPWLSVADNISFPQRARGDVRAQVDALLEEVGLRVADGALWPKQLSGGMAQRVAIARGLFQQPQLLLLDEPFSAVDAITRMRLQDLLLSITAIHRMAALIVTHDIDEALYLSDTVVLLTPPDARAGARSRTFTVDAPRPRDRYNAIDERLRVELLDGLDASVAGVVAAA
jgi:sulfonate transport system ATP-binding protein